MKKIVSLKYQNLDGIKFNDKRMNIKLVNKFYDTIKTTIKL